MLLRASVLAFLMALPSVALAGFPALPSQGVGHLGGAVSSAAQCSDRSYSTQGSCTSNGGTWSPARGSTGWYEIGDNAAAGLLVAAGVVVSFAGFRLVRRLIMTAGRG